jgi:hypothetical protein
MSFLGLLAFLHEKNAIAKAIRKLTTHYFEICTDKIHLHFKIVAKNIGKLYKQKVNNH